MLNSELAASNRIALMIAAHNNFSIAVREHLGDFQLMCHASVALDVTEEFQREYTFYLAPKTTVLHNLLRALALDS